MLEYGTDGDDFSHINIKAMIFQFINQFISNQECDPNEVIVIIKLSSQSNQWFWWFLSKNIHVCSLIDSDLQHTLWKETGCPLISCTLVVTPYGAGDGMMTMSCKSFMEHGIWCGYLHPHLQSYFFLCMFIIPWKTSFDDSECIRVSSFDRKAYDLNSFYWR